MSRALFNDAQVARKVKDEFIAVNGAIERLQPDRYGWHETASSKWFLAMASRKFKGDPHLEAFFSGFGTYQGIYVAGPDGTPYAYTNTLLYGDLTPAKLVATLDEALREYKKRPPARSEITPEQVREAAPDGLDPSTSVLRVFSRIKPAPDGYASPGIGRDHMWIFADEVRALLRGPAGVAFPMPRPIVARLVRFHLFDNSRNIGYAYEEGEVQRAEFSLKLLSQQGPVHRYALTGTFACERTDTEHKEKVGMDGKLEGEIDVDADQAKIIRFRACGEAKAWGDVGRTGAPPGTYPLVFALVEANDDVARTVPPVWHGISPVWSPIYRDPKLPGRTD